MKRAFPFITILVFVLSEFTLAQGPSNSVEFNLNNARNFSGKGLAKSKGVDFTIKYPVSFSLHEIANDNIVMSFGNESKGVMYFVGVTATDAVITTELEESILSEDNFKSSIKNVDPNYKFVSYKGGLVINGMKSSYMEFVATVSRGTKSHIRQYFLVWDRYLLSVSFSVPEIQISEAQTKSKFNNYKPFFVRVVNTLKVNPKERDDKIDAKEYREYVEQAPETDKNKLNETWIEELYRNKKYKFRVAFPKGWEYDGGTSKRTLARAIDRKKGVAISIGVTHLDIIMSKDSNNIYSGLPMSKTQMNEILVLQNQKLDNFSAKKGYLNNFPAYIYEFTSKQSAGTDSYIYFSKQVQCCYANKLYTLSINLPIEEWNNEMMIQFDRVVKSFVFEIAF